MGSPVPLNAKPAPALQSHLTPRVQAAEATEAQTQAPLAPIVDQPPSSSSPPLPSPQLLPPLQQYPWSPLGGAPLIFPFQPNVPGSQPAGNQPGMPIQPMVFPSFGYMPLFPPYTNQLLPPYRLPEAPLPQAPANQAPNALPAETSLTAAPVGDVVQTQQQQQQNPPVIYMMQQPMNPQLGGLSSEELQAAAKLSQMSMFTVLNTVGGGPVQPVNQGAGIANQENPNVGVIPAGVQKIQSPSGGAGGTPCANNQRSTGPQKPAPEPAAAADVD